MRVRGNGADRKERGKREEKEEREGERERQRESSHARASAWCRRTCLEDMLVEGRTYDRRWRSPCTNPAEAAVTDL